MWSPVEKTALADAEVEYHDSSLAPDLCEIPDLVCSCTSGNESLSVTLEKTDSPDLAHTFIVIWTTTPWTIPGNRAIAFSPDISYGLYQVSDAADGSLAKVGEKLLLADLLAENVAKDAKMMLSRVRTLEASELKTLIAEHPFRSLGYDFKVPLLAGAHVTAEAGTGFVHTAPGHGEDDFELVTSAFPDYAARNPDAFAVVEPDGSFSAKVPYFAGKRILTPEGKDGDANGLVIKADRARQASGQGIAASFLPRIAGAQSAGDFSRHAAMVCGDRQAHAPIRRQDIARIGARNGNCRNQMVSTARPEPHRLDGREPARLGSVASARLGRATGSLCR